MSMPSTVLLCSLLTSEHIHDLLSEATLRTKSGEVPLRLRERVLAVVIVLWVLAVAVVGVAGDGGEASN